jgi:hypothetical protein
MGGGGTGPARRRVCGRVLQNARVLAVRAPLGAAGLRGGCSPAAMVGGGPTPSFWGGGPSSAGERAREGVGSAVSAGGGGHELLGRRRRRTISTGGSSSAVVAWACASLAICGGTGPRERGARGRGVSARAHAQGARGRGEGPQYRRARCRTQLFGPRRPRFLACGGCRRGFRRTRTGRGSETYLLGFMGRSEVDVPGLGGFLSGRRLLEAVRNAQVGHRRFRDFPVRGGLLDSCNRESRIVCRDCPRTWCNGATRGCARSCCGCLDRHWQRCHRRVSDASSLGLTCQ